MPISANGQTYTDAQIKDFFASNPDNNAIGAKAAALGLAPDQVANAMVIGQMNQDPATVNPYLLQSAQGTARRLANNEAGNATIKGDYGPGTVMTSFGKPQGVDYTGGSGIKLPSGQEISKQQIADYFGTNPTGQAVGSYAQKLGLNQDQVQNALSQWKGQTYEGNILTPYAAGAVGGDAGGASNDGGLTYSAPSGAYSPSFQGNPYANPNMSPLRGSAPAASPVGNQGGLFSPQQSGQQNFQQTQQQAMNQGGQATAPINLMDYVNQMVHNNGNMPTPGAPLQPGLFQNGLSTNGNSSQFNSLRQQVMSMLQGGAFGGIQQAPTKVTPYDPSKIPAWNPAMNPVPNLFAASGLPGQPATGAPAIDPNAPVPPAIIAQLMQAFRQSQADQTSQGS